MSKINEAVKNSYFVLSLSVAGIFIGYLLRIFLSRTLSMEDFGLFYAVSAFIGLFTLVRYLGLNQALAKFIPEFLVKNEKGKIKASVITVLVIQTATIIAFTAIIVLFRDAISYSLFKSGSAGAVLTLMTLSFLPSMFFSVFQSVFQGYQKLRTYAVVEPVRILLTFIFSVAFISYGAEGVALAYLAAATATTIIFLRSFYSLGMLKAKAHPSFGLLKKITKFSIPVFVSSIAAIIITYTDTIAITFYRTLGEVALYQVALPTSQLLLVFSSSIVAVAFPLISELYSRRKLDDIEKGVRVMLILMVLLVMPFVALLVSFPEAVIMVLFGSSFLPAALALQVLSISVIFYSIFTIFQTTLDGIGRPLINTRIIFLMAAVNLVLNLTFVPPLGITGSAMASLIAYVLGVVLGLMYVKRYVNVSVPLYRLAKIFAGAILAGAVMLATKIFLQLPLYEEFAAALVLGWAAYAAFAVVSRAVTAEDVRFIESKGNMPRIIKKLARLVFREVVS